MTRQEANREIIKRLSKIVEDYPDLRFTQILGGLSLDDCLYYEESESTLRLTDWSNFKEKDL